MTADGTMDPEKAPPILNGDFAEASSRLAAGAAFDRLSVEGRIAGQQELRAIHQAYAANGADPMARGVATVGVPRIASHLAMLRAIQARLGA